MVIAQISDLHIGLEGRLFHGRFDAAARLARCVRDLLARSPAPDVVLATGDLVESGAAAEYGRLRELLQPIGAPLYLVPGNHDERGALREEFRDHDYLPPAGGPLRYGVEHGGLRLLALDTVIAGADGGALAEADLDWLAAQLAAAPEKPTVIFMHHPPIATGLRSMDAIALERGSAARLGAIVERHGCVERILCGHAHRSVQARWRGTVVSICPSTVAQARLALGEAPFAWSDEEPPAYQLHCWSGASLATHTVAVPSDR